MSVLETDYWTTPTDVTKGIIKFLEHYNEISWQGQEYDLDCCANEFNTKVKDNFITEDQNALKVDWNGKRIWCNPPYSRGNVEAFINKAIEQVEQSAKDVIMLLNVDPSTKYFAKIVQNAKAIVYVTGGRIKFIDMWTGGVGTSPTKASMFVLFSSRKIPTEFVRSYYVDLKALEQAGGNS